MTNITTEQFETQLKEALNVARAKELHHQLRIQGKHYS